MSKKSMVQSLLVGAFFLVLTAMVWLKPETEYSVTERRKLSAFPSLTWEGVSDGRFMSQFEEYATDQFPFRDSFRSLKAFVHFYVLGQNDNNDVYKAQGYISKLDYPLSEKALDRATEKFTSIYDSYIKGSEAKVYSVWIPDKNYYLAEQNGYPTYDYEALYTYVNDRLNYMTNIEIDDLLTIEDYYRTDTHWKQENIRDVADEIASKMNVTLEESYEIKTIDQPFYGVYYGQLALKGSPDQIQYVEHPIFADCRIINHDRGKEISMYDLEKASGLDPYELYLSGSLSVITIENPNATTDKELVIFRDSFGSSIAPYFVEAYSKITLLDVRYLNEAMIGQYVEFTNQDVLFLYSTGVLNTESAF